MLGIETELPTVKAPEVFDLFGVAWTNTMLGGLLVLLSIIALAIAIQLFANKKTIPSKFQLILESIIDMMFGLTDKIAGNSNLAKRIFPIVATLIIYIALSNTITILPGLEALEINGVQVFRIHTSDFSTTFGIALAIVMWTQIYSIKQKNIFVHLNQYIRIGTVVQGFRKGVGQGFMSLIDLFIGILDIIGEFAKVISLSARLFGNMFAGLMLNAIMLSAIAILAPSLLILYALFSGIIQAIVFGALSASYFSMAVDDN